MAQCIINGIQVLFPYEPYKIQEDYMKKVMECLQNGANGILESPTGTGKTLSLLCSTLAWLETRKAQQQLSIVQRSIPDSPAAVDLKSALDCVAGSWNDRPNFMLPKIIYSSRTHAQLSQAIQELKRSNYKHVKSVVLGSRDQLCLHPEVSKATNHTTKVYMCRAKTSSKSCTYFLNYEEKMQSQKEYQDISVLDIEDLVTLGKKHVVCPYYAARNLKTKVDILFAPYNYIIDPKSRRAQGIDLDGNVLIFDEAHNIEGACEEYMSFQLKSLDLALCINEVTQTIAMVKDFDKDFSSSDNGSPDFTLTDLSILKVMFCELEEVLDKAVAECSASGGSKPGDYMIEVLSKVELTPQRKDVVIDLLDKIILYHSTNVSTGALWTSKGTGLQKFSDLLKILFSRVAEGHVLTDFKKEFSQKFRVFLQYESTANKSQSNSDPWTVQSISSKKKQSWKLDCWCFSPGIGMKDIMERGVHCILLTSGTLSPLAPMISELGIRFPVQLENPHIIKDNQVFVGVVNCGPDGTPLNSSYQNRSNETYISSLGRTISNFCKITPDGVLIFFPSYSVMKANVGFWENNGIWQNLSGIKPLFVEPQGKDAFQESIHKFYSTIKDANSKGATLLAVCRGKVSEGLDFADENARAVVITGLPFPPSMDPRVKMKMAYLNSIAKETKGLSGTEWYVLQASRAVNQAIGRVIRHKDDYGAILLCDNRFREKRIQSQLSKWIHNRVQVFDSFGPSLKHLSTFFKTVEKNPRKPKHNCQSLGGFKMESVLKRCNLNENSSQQSLLTNPVASSSSSDTSLYKSYLQSSNAEKTGGVSNNKPSSIFDVMDKHTKRNSLNTSCMTQSSSSSIETSNIQGTNSETKNSKECKRRKISIQFVQADKVQNDKNSIAEMWKKYLVEVKTLLGVSQKYNNFCSAVKDFRMRKDTTEFAVNMKQVFSEIPNRKEYLQTASKLVASKDREKFLSLCL